MKAKKRGNSSSSWDDIHELTEQELDSIVGGADPTVAWQDIIDTEGIRTVETFHIDKGIVISDGKFTTTFGKGTKNPYYNKDGKNNLHTIDFTKLQ